MTLDRPDVPRKQGHYIFEEMSKVITNPVLSLNSKALLPSLCLDAVRHQNEAVVVRGCPPRLSRDKPGNRTQEVIGSIPFRSTTPHSSSAIYNLIAARIAPSDVWLSCGYSAITSRQFTMTFMGAVCRRRSEAR